MLNNGSNGGDRARDIEDQTRNSKQQDKTPSHRRRGEQGACALRWPRVPVCHAGPEVQAEICRQNAPAVGPPVRRGRRGSAG
jgi:hypothetical protein